MASRPPRWLLPELTPLLRSYVLTVMAVGGLTAAGAALVTRWRVHEVATCLVLLGFGAVTVEVIRRVGEPAGTIKDVHGVWELPIALLLPPVYALIIPLVWQSLTQLRIRRTLLHRRLFSAAAIGLSYGAASVLFHALWPCARPSDGPLVMLVWTALAAAAGVLRWALNYSLVWIALRLNDPAARLADLLGDWSAIGNEGAELSLGILVSYCALISPILLALMLPCGALLQRSARHAQLVHASRTDPKTGLLTAPAWQAEAAVLTARAQRSGIPVAAAMIDIDHFKVVNDTYGHLAGDEVLASVAKTLRAGLRPGDLAARFGGEEFCLLLPDVTSGEAMGIAERLRACLAQVTIPLPGLDGSLPHITVSIGVSALTGGITDPTDLLAAADAALYQAKQSGRNAVRLAG